MSIFGPIVDAAQIEAAVRDVLKDWFATYLQEIELQRGLTRGAMPAPRSYLVTEDMAKEPEDQMPAVVIISPGLAGDEPEMYGDGAYTARWTVGVGVFASANTRENTSTLIRRYTAAIRAILLQKRPESVTRVDWIDESYDDLEFDDDRTFGAGQVIFEMEVCEVVTRRGGPAAPTPPDPATQPGSDWPDVQSAHVTEELVEEVQQ